MADWTGMWRTNYFAVQDDKKFRKWVRSLIPRPVKTEQVTTQGHTFFGLYADSRNDFGIPWGCEQNDGKAVEIDFCEKLGQQLMPGEVAVIMEVGHLQVQCVSGHAIAVMWDAKEQVVRYTAVRLSDIYDQVQKEFGIKTNPAEY